MAIIIKNKDKTADLWLVVLLLYVTFGLYYPYWIYKNVKNMYTDNNIPVRPWLWTLGTIVPILNVYLQWKFFNDVNNFARRKSISACPSPHLYMVLYIIAIAVISYFSAALPEGISFLFTATLSVIYTVYVQDIINRYWQI